MEKQLAKVKEKVQAATSQTSLEALERHLSDGAAHIVFAHGPGRRTRAEQKVWEALAELR